jgi:hypothetical protein
LLFLFVRLIIVVPPTSFRLWPSGCSYRTARSAAVVVVAAAAAAAVVVVRSFQACEHCHVDSSPKRKEMMSREVTDRCLHVIKNSPSVEVVDITGGAPELNAQFRYWVRSLSSRCQ